MEWTLIVVLALWNTYNTLTLWHNNRQDRRGDILDKCTVKVMQIHNQRLMRLEDAVGLDHNIDIEGGENNGKVESIRSCITSTR